MPAPANPFKAALRERRVQLGIWSTLSSPLVAELLARSGFDWVMFDAEHSPLEIAELLPLLQAAANGTAAAVVRPPWNDPVLIKRVLDLGAQSILVPFVQSASEASAAVRSVRYPPHGIRGVSAATRASRFGRVPDYLTTANHEMCLLVQVETREALRDLVAIASTDGIDGVFIGPSDLSASFGHLGNPGHPEVQAAIREAAGTILSAGKAPGILATNAADARRYVEWGYVFVACGVDLRLLAAGVDDLHAQAIGKV